ncbi:magnesium transporter CorA family protein [Lysobacter auxotrophicus]|uniref:CorA family divalent cation transporter n=1 Tax=Lysobacter auxotrophicus TaxID=2992573 RepID=A0ABM8DCT8_9GAMM|nr:CorA family divalent cation transporter [Lysobacter auxotrophicus]BDU16404.1 CorA family divalent cation transporter [Lysobacter auxotrophicus]
MPDDAGTRDIRLFDSNGKVEAIDLDAANLDNLQEHQLLWIDLEGGGDPSTAQVLRTLGLHEDIVGAFCDRSAMPELRVNNGTFFVRVVAVRNDGDLAFNGSVLAILTGHNFVITAHQEPMDFITQLRERESDDSGLGMLSADSFTASLLDWHLNTYFEAVADFESADERLETDILDDRHGECLHSLRGLRKAASRLRRMLSAHRGVFSAIARPDFRPGAEGEVNRHFQTVDTHFQRAMEAVENAREVVIGSFELFSNQTALRTNAIMRVLTILTAVMGGLAVVAGVLGMNFQAPFFDTGLAGFLIAVGAMLGMALVGLWWAWRRKWL